MSNIIIGEPLKDDGMCQATIDISFDDVKSEFRDNDLFSLETQYTHESVFLVVDNGIGNVTIYPSTPSSVKKNYSIDDFTKNEERDIDELVTGLIVEGKNWETDTEGLFSFIIEILDDLD